MKKRVLQYCVIGYPIGHSLSPRLHNSWFRAAKIPARYGAVSVPPARLAAFMRTFRDRYAGANVTIPHKTAVMRFLDELSPEARKIGAVNTMVNKGGKLVGYNTDVFGAMAALREAKSKNVILRLSKDGAWLRSKRAIVLGAGGAARAIVYGLCKAGAKVFIWNRTAVHARRLAREFGCHVILSAGTLVPTQIMRRSRNFIPFDYDILINATSVGMWPRVSESPLDLREISLLLLHRKSASAVMDIIYHPRLTRFLRDAKAAGCRIITGDKMFLAQAAKSFELWTGREPPPTRW